MILMCSIILPVQSTVSLRSDASQLAVIQTSVSTNFHLTSDVHAQSVREFERVEERVSYYRCTLVYRFRFKESGIVM